MKTKKIIAFSVVITTLLLGGCVATPYYGGSVSYGSGGYYRSSIGGGYRYGYRPSVYRTQTIFSGYRNYGGGHRHINRSYYQGGHRHSSRNHFRGGYRQHQHAIGGGRQSVRHFSGGQRSGGGGRGRGYRD